MHWFILSLIALFLVTITQTAHYNAKFHRDYMKCTPETEFNPGVCDCRGTECFINLTVTKNKFDNGAIDEAQLFSVNGGRIGPTIIVNYNALVVVDVYNEINDTEDPENANLSMHWHGMHQWNTAWMDGVGMITQWPTVPHAAFRYIFRANPSGTHWYHSHILFQRDEGVVGALIVRDRSTIRSRILLKNVVDDPGETMFAIRDHIEVTNGANVTANDICLPDRSMYPLVPMFGRYGTRLDLFRLNGVKLADHLPYLGNGHQLKPIYYVERGKKYRFRIIGIMSSNVLRFSIDKHRLQVMSTDGYLAEKFETDILIFHIAERYDFILETNDAYEAGTIFPIRIETVAVQCNDYTTPVKVGYAYLQYVERGVSPGKPKLVDHYHGRHRCEVEPCIALNCPFEQYPPEANTICHNVKELSLLDPTPWDQVPIHDHYVTERFLNFAFGENGPAVNGLSNELPSNIPFVNSENKAVENECKYEDITRCDEMCAHALHIGKRNIRPKFTPRTVRFVFSSLTTGNSLATHPIHLHGHSFFVAKIAYPIYNESGAIVEVNPDLIGQDCGPAHWTNNTAPDGIEVNRRTIRKDVIIVPAGGYVVIEFQDNNPGLWFLHCHIDAHSNRGMAIAVNELPQCQNLPRYYSAEDPYLLSRHQFLYHEKCGDKCDIMNAGQNPWKIEAREMKDKSDVINARNLGQSFVSKYLCHG